MGTVEAGGSHYAPYHCGEGGVCVGLRGPPGGPHGGGSIGPHHRPPLKSLEMIPGLSNNLRRANPVTTTTLKILHGNRI